MSRYLALRLALLPLTLTLVLGLMFVVLNLAPGEPEPEGEGGSRRVAPESIRLFRAHFGLDRAILFDTSAWRTSDDLRTALLCREGGCSGRERRAATQLLDEGGEAIVAALLPLLEDPTVSPLAEAALAHAAGPTWRERVRTEPERFRPGLGAKLLHAVTHTRLARYATNLARLDLGVSTVDRSPVAALIAQRLGATLALTLSGLLLALVLAVPLGVLAAVRGGALDRALGSASLLLFSAPSFFVGVILLQLLAQRAQLFPSGGLASLDAIDRTLLGEVRDRAWHLVLPVLTYAVGPTALFLRHVRASMTEVLGAEFIRTARAKGLSEPVVLVRHALPNALAPLVTILGAWVPALVSGSIVIEVTFGLPGVGPLLFDAIQQRDYNVVMGVLLLVSVATLLGVLLSDLAHALIDPRVGFEARG